MKGFRIWAAPWYAGGMLRIIQRMQPLFLALALLFIVLLLRSQWEELSQHTWHLNLGWLSASALFMLASWALEIQVWRRLLAVVGAHLPYWPAVRIWFLSAIVRYIPGNIWQPLSMTLLCQRRGIAPEATLTSVALYQILILLAASPIAAALFWLDRQLGAAHRPAAGVDPVAGGGRAGARRHLCRAALLADRHGQLGAWPSSTARRSLAGSDALATLLGC